MKRALLMLCLLLAACGNSTSTPSRLHLAAGTNFTATFNQVTTAQSTTTQDNLGQIGSESLDSTFSAQEHFHVVSVDATGIITVTVSLDSFSASTANTEPISTPAAFQFTLDSRSQVLSGEVWPALGAVATLPAADQFCVPLPATPLSSSMTWQSPLGHSRAGSFAASVDSIYAGYPAQLNATSQATFTTPVIAASPAAITGHSSQTLICQFDLDTSRPHNLQSSIDFQFTQTAVLGTATQTTVETGTVVTTIVYTF